MKTALVIMAAGMGSRFGGGIKQLEPVGPNGEIIMDYSIHDAIEAGFNKVVFIIRKDIKEAFHDAIGKRIEGICNRLNVEFAYAYQELDDLPEEIKKPVDRSKPWGTGQAVLVCKDIIKEPFVVINADDYYGKEAFVKLHDFLVSGEDGQIKCDSEEVQEWISPEDKVSMNMWAGYPEFLDFLAEDFKDFLANVEEGDLKSEYLLPNIVDKLLKEDRANVKVLETQDRWFGVTYKEDKETVQEAFRELIADGVYAEMLWE